MRGRYLRRASPFSAWCPGGDASPAVPANASFAIISLNSRYHGRLHPSGEPCLTSKSRASFGSDVMGTGGGQGTSPPRDEQHVSRGQTSVAPVAVAGHDAAADAVDEGFCSLPILNWSGSSTRRSNAIRCWSAPMLVRRANRRPRQRRWQMSGQTTGSRRQCQPRRRGLAGQFDSSWRTCFPTRSAPRSRQPAAQPHVVGRVGRAVGRRLQP